MFFPFAISIARMVPDWDSDTVGSFLPHFIGVVALCWITTGRSPLYRTFDVKLCFKDSVELLILDSLSSELEAFTLVKCMHFLRSVVISPFNPSQVFLSNEIEFLIQEFSEARSLMNMPWISFTIILIAMMNKLINFTCVFLGFCYLTTTITAVVDMNHVRFHICQHFDRHFQKILIIND